MTIGANLAAGSSSLLHERNDDDFYQTEKEATHALMRFLMWKWYREDGVGDLNVWDCCCGKGMMTEEVIKYEKLVGSIIATDLVERGYGTGDNDFLKIEALPHTPRGVYDTIIINQPFELSYEFFEHAKALGVKRLVMLMKAQYWHSNWQQKPRTSEKMWEGWTPSWWLPMTWRVQFGEKKNKNGKKNSPTMDTAWCVWDRHAKHEGCLMFPLKKPRSF